MGGNGATCGEPSIMQGMGRTMLQLMLFLLKFSSARVCGGLLQNIMHMI